MRIAAELAGFSGILPLALLFWEYRRRKHIHKPLIYLAVFILSIAVLLPLLLHIFGLWLALMAPVAVFAYAFAVRGIRRRNPES